MASWVERNTALTAFVMAWMSARTVGGSALWRIEVTRCCIVSVRVEDVSSSVDCTEQSQ